MWLWKQTRDIHQNKLKMICIHKENKMPIRTRMTKITTNRREEVWWRLAPHPACSPAMINMIILRVLCPTFAPWILQSQISLLPTYSHASKESKISAKAKMHMTSSSTMGGWQEAARGQREPRRHSHTGEKSHVPRHGATTLRKLIISLVLYWLHSR